MSSSTTQAKTNTASHNKSGIARWCGGMLLAAVGFDLPSWLAILRRHGYRVSPSKIPAALAVTLTSLFISCMKLIEDSLYGARIRGTRIHESPLFILGHWRSGTTLLHELLSRDERFTFPTSFACFNPHCFLLSEGLLKACIRLVVPARRPQDNMASGPDNPQEDEFALALMGAVSPYATHLFPSQLGACLEAFEPEALPAKESQQWEKAFLRFLKKITLRRNRPLILKSPPHTFRIATLLRLFPEARFVYLVRNPLAVFPSTVYTWRNLWEATSLQGQNIPGLEEYVHEVFSRMHLAFERDRHLIAQGRLHIMRYEELAAQPEREIEKLYTALKLGGYEQVRPKVRAYAAQNARYKKNTFSISTELRERITRRWAPFISQYGYADRAEESGAISPPCGHAACSAALSNQHDNERLP